MQAVTLSSRQTVAPAPSGLAGPVIREHRCEAGQPYFDEFLCTGRRRLAILVEACDGEIVENLSAFPAMRTFLRAPHACAEYLLLLRCHRILIQVFGWLAGLDFHATFSPADHGDGLHLLVLVGVRGLRFAGHTSSIVPVRTIASRDRGFFRKKKLPEFRAGNRRPGLHIVRTGTILLVSGKRPGEPPMEMMMKTTKKPNLKAEAAYENAQLVATDLLIRLQELLHDLPAPESDGIDWTHVGTVSHLNHKLSELVEFLTPESIEA